MDKPQRDARISRMEQRTLALDDIPMIGGGIRRQAFSGASREIGNDGVHRDTAAGDEDAGLATGAEIRLRAARAQCTGQRSAARRGGNECVLTCRSRWSPYH